LRIQKHCFVFTMACLIAVLVAGLPAVGTCQAGILKEVQLASVGLADLQKYEVVSITYDDSGLDEDERFWFVVRVDFSLPGFDLKGSREYEIGKFRVEKKGSPIHISNLDIDINLGADEPVNVERLEKKLDQYRDRIEIVGDDIGIEEKVAGATDDELPEAESVINDIVAANGLLPEFEISIELEMVTEHHETTRSTARFTNRHPRPLQVLGPSGEIEDSRPVFTWRIPRVSADIEYLENELILEEADTGNVVWRRTIRLNPGDYGSRFSYRYPGDEDPLEVGVRYRQRNLLRDPYSAASHLARFVGAGAGPEGQTATFELAQERVRLDEPDNGSVVDTVMPSFSWKDENRGDVKEAVAGYVLRVGSNEIDTGKRHRYTYRGTNCPPLELGETYRWSVRPYTRGRRMLPEMESEEFTFTVPALLPAGVANDMIVSPRAGESYSNGQEVQFQVNPAVFENWPGLEVRWDMVDGPWTGRILGEKPDFGRQLPAGAGQSVKLTVTHPVTGTSHSQVVCFDVYEGLSEEDIKVDTNKTRYLAGEPVDVSVDIQGGLPPYRVEVVTAGYDAHTETGAGPFSFRLPGLPAGTQEINVRVSDERGEEVSSKADIRVSAPLLEIVDGSGRSRTNFTLAESPVLHVRGDGRYLGDLPVIYDVSWRIDGQETGSGFACELQPSHLGRGVYDVTVDLFWSGELVSSTESRISISGKPVTVTVDGLGTSWITGEARSAEVSVDGATLPCDVVLYAGDTSLARLEGVDSQVVLEWVTGLLPGTETVYAYVIDADGDEATSGAVDVEILPPEVTRISVMSAGIETDMIGFEDEAIATGVFSSGISFADSPYGFQWKLAGEEIGTGAQVALQPGVLGLRAGESYQLSVDVLYGDSGALATATADVRVEDICIPIQVTVLEEEITLGEALPLEINYRLIPDLLPYTVSLTVTDGDIEVFSQQVAGVRSDQLAVDLSIPDPAPGDYTLSVEVTDNQDRTFSSSGNGFTITTPQIMQISFSREGETGTFLPDDSMAPTVRLQGWESVNALTAAIPDYSVRWYVDGEPGPAIADQGYLQLVDLGVGLHTLACELFYGDRAVERSEALFLIVPGETETLMVAVTDLPTEHEPFTDLRVPVVIQQATYPVTVQVIIDGAAVEPGYTANESSTVIDIAGLPAGAHTLQVAAEDSTGRKGLSQVYSLFVPRQETGAGPFVEITGRVPRAERLPVGTAVVLQAIAGDEYGQDLSSDIRWKVDDIDQDTTGGQFNFTVAGPGEISITAYIPAENVGDEERIYGFSQQLQGTAAPVAVIMSLTSGQLKRWNVFAGGWQDTSAETDRFLRSGDIIKVTGVPTGRACGEVKMLDGPDQPPVKIRAGQAYRVDDSGISPVEDPAGQE